MIRPRCLLLDEPLSNLDAKLRLEMRTEIRRVCKEHQLTTVYVTHDQKEALSICDRLAVLDAGEVLQVGTAREVYRRPNCSKVAHFIGEADSLPGRVESVAGGRIFVRTAVGSFEGLPGNPSSTVAPGAAVQVTIRPESWILSGSPRSGGVNSVAGRIGTSTYLGEVAQYEFIPRDDTAVSLKALELNPRLRDPGSERELQLTVAPDDVIVLPV